MNAFEAYSQYTALRLHFTKPSYDYLKYRGKTRVSAQKLRVRRDIYKFEKLARKHGDHFEEFVVGNLIHGNGFGWIGELDTPQAEENFRKLRKIKESLTYHYTEDIKRLLNKYQKIGKIFLTGNGTLPIMIEAYMRGEINFETLVILCNIFPTDEIPDVLWADVKMKVVKFRPWIPADLKKFKRILIDEIRNAKL